METIEQEAENYSNKSWGNFFNDFHPDPAITESVGEISIKDFIAGANSKWVKSEKIKAQIEVLKELRTSVEDYYYIDVKIEQLEKQLKWI